MKFIDYLRIGLKNIWRQKLRTVLTIFAIVIGATSVVIMLALVVGAKTIFLKQIESSGILTQVVVTSNTDVTSEDAFNGGGGGSTDIGVKLTDSLADKVRKTEHVNSVSPILGVYDLQNFRLEGNDKNVSGRGAVAYEPGPDNDKQLLVGRNLTKDDNKNVVIYPARFLDKVGYKDNPSGLLGKTIIFTTYKGYNGEGANIPKPIKRADGGYDFPKQENVAATEIKATVVGITASGGDQDDRMYIPLEWAKGIMTRQHWGFNETAQRAYDEARKQGQDVQPPGLILIKESELDRRGYDSFIVKVDSTSNVETVAAEIRKLNIGASTAKDIIKQFESTFKVVALVLGAIGGISLVVAAIGVINTMVMAILERTREIGIMRACGAQRKTIRRLFMFEASLLGFWGGVFGVLAGFGLSKVANVFINKALIAQNANGRDLIGLPLWLGLSVIGATTVIGLLAGLYPAFRAARLNPVEALRHE